MGDAPKVEFALGSEVSLEHFFKSSFARAFVSTSRDSKSLDYELFDNVIAEDLDPNGNTDNNNFFSLVNFGNTTIRSENRVSGKDSVNLWKQIEVNRNEFF